MTKILMSRKGQAVLGLSVVGAIVGAFAGIAGATTPTASAETTSLIATETGAAFPVVLAVAGGLVTLIVFIWAVSWALGVFHAKKAKV